MSDYCICKDCGCKHLVWEKSCPYCRRIAELEAEVARLGKVYLEGAEQTRRVLAKEVAENTKLKQLAAPLTMALYREMSERHTAICVENAKLREAVTALAKIAPQNNARAAVLKKLEAGNDTTTNTT